MRAALVAISLAALTACSGGGGSAGSLCQAVGQIDGVGATFQGFDPTDREAALDQLRPARVTLGNLLDKAPREVRADIQVEVDYLQALIDSLQAAKPGDPADAVQRVQAVTDAHPKVAQAAAALQTFTIRECSPSST